MAFGSTVTKLAGAVKRGAPKRVPKKVIGTKVAVTRKSVGKVRKPPAY